MTIHIEGEPPTRTAINNPQKAAKEPSREKPTKKGGKNPQGVEAKWGRKRTWAHDSERRESCSPGKGKVSFSRVLFFKREMLWVFFLC